ncbi:MAG: YkgJ family cysteine cluster protein, partial [Archangium sp.]
MSPSDLCRRCGLCCDGNLFSHVPLERAEVSAARCGSLDVVELADGAPALRLCCTALKGRQCTRYAERPEGCRRYVCQLLTGLAEGRVSPEEALAVVEQAHALLSALEAGLAPEASSPPPSILERARFADLADRAPSPELRVLRERTEDFL